MSKAGEVRKIRIRYPGTVLLEKDIPIFSLPGIISAQLESRSLGLSHPNAKVAFPNIIEGGFRNTRRVDLFKLSPDCLNYRNLIQQLEFF